MGAELSLVQKKSVIPIAAVAVVDVATAADIAAVDGNIASG